MFSTIAMAGDGGWYLMQDDRLIGILYPEFPDPKQLILILNGDANACEEGMPDARDRINAPSETSTGRSE